MSDPHRTNHDSYLNNFKGGAKPKIIGIGREVMALKKEGEEFPIYLAIADMKLDGQFFFSAVIRDISEQKKHEAELAKYTLDLAKNINELERSNRELNDFAYVASHDLKAPLRGVLQIVNWIEEDLEGTLSSQVNDYFSLMKSRITRLEKLLDDLLSYSRAGRNHGDFRETSLSDMAIDLFELLDPPERFKLVLEDNLPSFTTLATPLEIIVRNLMNNAIKHHDKANGTITVSAQKNDTGYLISIKDDGPGIAPRFHEKIFGIFQTLKPRDEVEGSGMGLAVVKKLVETYQGEISVLSDGESGAEMRFSWPDEATLRKLLDE
jgi:signal transduction histidine kinase